MAGERDDPTAAETELGGTDDNLVKEVARILTQWEDSDELATPLARRLVLLVRSMTEQELRLECLRLACSLRPPIRDIAAIADDFVTYLSASEEADRKEKVPLFREIGP